MNGMTLKEILESDPLTYIYNEMNNYIIEHTKTRHPITINMIYIPVEWSPYVKKALAEEGFQKDNEFLDVPIIYWDGIFTFGSG